MRFLNVQERSGKRACTALAEQGISGLPARIPGLGDMADLVANVLSYLIEVLSGH